MTPSNMLAGRYIIFFVQQRVIEVKCRCLQRWEGLERCGGELVLWIVVPVSDGRGGT